MERPTTASAAATTMIKKMNITPLSEFIDWAKPTNERLTAFSINSMLMKITIALRRSKTPSTPMEKSSELRTRI